MDQALESGIITTDGVRIFPAEDSPAERAGITDTDILEQVNGASVKTPGEAVESIRSASDSVSLTLRSVDGEVRTLSVPLDDERIGAGVGYNISDLDQDFTYDLSPIAAVGAGFSETWAQTRLTLELL